jgi:redox-sensitive bicupin YhaK (pirin superfamily)
MKTRKILYVADAFQTLEGDGVPIRRAIPSRAVQLGDVDPFLLLDDFEAPPVTQAGPSGFSQHPHRGFEIITYLLSGRIADEVEGEKAQLIEAGGLQRITAGSGTFHGGGQQEISKDPIHGLQIWINLAQADKKLKPDFQVFTPEQLPVKALKGASARILVGEGSPVTLHTQGTFVDFQMEAGAELDWELPASWRGYAYGLKGEGSLGGEKVKAAQIAVLGEGGALNAKAGPGGFRFLLAAGMPHREPIRWRGPYVD